MVAQLSIDQVHVDLLLVDISFLSHFGQRARQVHDSVSTVVFRKKQNSQMLTFFLKLVVAIWLCILWRGVWRRVGAEMGSTEGQGGFTSWAKVRFERAPDTRVCLGEVVLKDSCSLLTHSSFNYDLQDAYQFVHTRSAKEFQHSPPKPQSRRRR